MKKSFASIVAITLLATAAQSPAAIISFFLEGTGGMGLLSTNETHVVTNGGSGGLRGTGISFNDETNVLSLNFGWGSNNGFTDLSGNAAAGHIHGPTTNGGLASFTQTAGVRYGLDALAGWNNSASAGGFIGDVNILPEDASALLDGRFYVNVHTATNGAGEIRGNLIAVPEPSGALLAGVALLGMALRRRRLGI